MFDHTTANIRTNTGINAEFARKLEKDVDRAAYQLREETARRKQSARNRSARNRSAGNSRRETVGGEASPSPRSGPLPYPCRPDTWRQMVTAKKMPNAVHMTARSPFMMRTSGFVWPWKCVSTYSLKKR